MHAITISYSLSYAAAVRLGVPRSGTDTVDAEHVLPLLEPRERAWLAEHPRATFALDAVIESAADLESGLRIASAVAREIRSACAADDPARLRAAVAASLIRDLDDARGGGYVSGYASVPRRVCDGNSAMSGNVEVLTDEDVSPGMMRALDRYLDRCLAELKLPDLREVKKAPKLVREVYLEGERRVQDRAVQLALEAARNGALDVKSSAAGAQYLRARLRDGALGLTPEGTGAERVWRVDCSSPKFIDARLSGVLEDAIVVIEREEEAHREEAKAKQTAKEAAILAVLDDEQRLRRKMGALSREEIDRAVYRACLVRLQELVGDGYAVLELDEQEEDDDDCIEWGLLPRGGGDVAAILDKAKDVTRWGRLDLDVVVEVELLDGSSCTFKIERV